MKTIHPNEQEIQEYALNQLTSATSIANHVAECASCKQKVIEYANLFKAIEQEQEPAFNFDLANLVMQQIDVAKESKVDLKNTFTLPYFLIATAILIIVVYSFNMFLMDLPLYVNSQPGNLLALGALIILLFLCYDSYRSYKKKLTKINLC